MKRQKLRRVLITASAVLFPVTFFYLSPYLIIMAAGERVISGSFITFGAMLLASLLFGRAFCGWVCPVGGIGEAVAKVRDKRMERRWVDWIKIGYWPLWLGFVAFMAVRAGGFTRVDFLYQTWHGISVSNVGSAVLAAGIVAVVVVLTITVGRRGFCHSLCWMAPFMMLGSWIRDRLQIPGLRLHATPGTCISCGACTRNCPMSLGVQKGMVGRNNMAHRECILCGSCADVCPTKTIALRFVSRRTKERAVGAKKLRLLCQGRV